MTDKKNHICDLIKKHKNQSTILKYHANFAFNQKNFDK